MCGTTYAVPLNTVSEAVFTPQRDVERMLGNETVLIRNETLVLCRLSAFFGLEAQAPQSGDLCVVVVSLGRRRLGLVVDSLESQQDVVIKPLGASLRDKTCFSGAADVGEERLALVLDTSHVIERFFTEHEGPAPGTFAAGQR